MCCCCCCCCCSRVGDMNRHDHTRARLGKEGRLDGLGAGRRAGSVPSIVGDGSGLRPLERMERACVGFGFGYQRLPRSVIESVCFAKHDGSLMSVGERFVGQQGASSKWMFAAVDNTPHLLGRRHLPDLNDNEVSPASLGSGRVGENPDLPSCRCDWLRLGRRDARLAFCDAL